jgi:hypothetical protein
VTHPSRPCPGYLVGAPRDAHAAVAAAAAPPPLQWQRCGGGPPTGTGPPAVSAPLPAGLPAARARRAGSGPWVPRAACAPCVCARVFVSIRVCVGAFVPACRRAPLTGSPSPRCKQAFVVVPGLGGPGTDGRNKGGAERLMQPLLARIDQGLGHADPPAHHPAAAEPGFALEGPGRTGPDRPPFEFVMVEAVLYVLEQVRDRRGRRARGPAAGLGARPQARQGVRSGRKAADMHRRQTGGKGAGTGVWVWGTAGHYPPLPKTHTHAHMHTCIHARQENPPSLTHTHTCTRQDTRRQVDACCAEVARIAAAVSVRRTPC